MSKAIKSKICKCLQTGSKLVIADNSGAKEIQIINVYKYKGVKRRISKGGIGDIFIGAVTKGKPEIKHKLEMAIIIRQRKAIARADGTRVKFEDNAAVLVKDRKIAEPKGTIVKGPVAREVTERFSKLSKVCKVIV